MIASSPMIVRSASSVIESECQVVIELKRMVTFLFFLMPHGERPMGNEGQPVSRKR